MLCWWLIDSLMTVAINVSVTRGRYGPCCSNEPIGSNASGAPVAL